MHLRNAVPLVIVPALFLLVIAGCKKDEDAAPENTVDRGALLRDVTSNVIVPAYDAFATEARALADSAQAFAATPDQGRLLALRSEWNLVMDEWMDCEMFRFGYQYDASVNAQIATWPINPVVIESEISGSGPIDEAYITATGTTRKGLSAVEYLLYGTTNDEDVLHSFTSGPLAARRSTYLVSLCMHIATTAHALANVWDPAGGNYGATFASATQSDISGSLNLLVNAWIEHIETMRRLKVEIPLGIENGGTAQPDDVENLLSQRSLANIRANIVAWGTIFSCGNGNGIDDNLDAVKARYENAPLSGKIRDQFTACLAACDAITVPLDQAVTTQHDAVNTLYIALKRLTVLTKLDMASDLGVIITFSDTDGD